MVLVAEFELDERLGEFSGFSDDGDGRSGFDLVSDALEQPVSMPVTSIVAMSK